MGSLSCNILEELSDDIGEDLITDDVAPTTGDFQFQNGDTFQFQNGDNFQFN